MYHQTLFECFYKVLLSEICIYGGGRWIQYTILYNSNRDLSQSVKEHRLKGWASQSKKKWPETVFDLPQQWLFLCLHLKYYSCLCL